MVLIVHEYVCTDSKTHIASSPCCAPLYLSDLMDYLLKVPLEMFLPYVSAGILTAVIVANMLNLQVSKWKAVASLCNDTACGCVCRTGLCGTDCSAESSEPLQLQHRAAHTVQPSGTTRDDFLSLEPRDTKKSSSERDPIEKQLVYLFFQLPQVDETRENANVITSVCIGLLVMLCKLPKFLLYVVHTENYVLHDPALFAMIDHMLDVLFAACKPMVCILVGAHFRRVLMSPTSCHRSNPGKEVTSGRPAATHSDALIDRPAPVVA